MQEKEAEVQVWDWLVRVGHWVLVAAIAVAYLSEGEPEWLHVNAGYVASGYVLLRIIWGFVGPQHARFADFVTGPGTGLRYLVRLLRRQSPRYLGHSPAGGWMILMLFATIMLTGASGLVLYGQEGEGPLAGVVPQVREAPDTPAPQAVDDADDAAAEAKGKHEDSWIEELHDVLANLVILLALLHVGGVALASRAHHENLVRAMLTGRKPVDRD